MYQYFDNLFLNYQCGFRKSFNAQHSLITMIEKQKRSVDGDDRAGALLTDLSKAFDSIDHELLIAKLYAYVFDKNFLYICNLYLKGWKLFSVPQGSVLGALLFNMYVRNLFLANSNIDIANYADGNAPYTCLSFLEKHQNNF